MRHILATRGRRDLSLSATQPRRQIDQQECRYVAFGDAGGSLDLVLRCPRSCRYVGVHRPRALRGCQRVAHKQNQEMLEIVNPSFFVVL
eukprot:COSAG02_NODE_5183_length_4561_cov_2.015240_2_plen_89_part_00